jgi:uncharacterized membrane protein (DUF106 family)
MRMYRVSFDRIEPIEVLSQTEKTVTYLEYGRKQTEKKQTNYGGYYNTFDEAKASIEKKYIERLKENKRQLVYLTEQLSKVQNLQP